MGASYEATKGFEKGASVKMERSYPNDLTIYGTLGLLYTVDGRDAEDAQWCADVYSVSGGRYTCWFGKDKLARYRNDC